MRWTADKVAVLETGWRDGLSSGEIARRIPGATRGAVARKRGHHGLKPRGRITEAQKLNGSRNMQRNFGIKAGGKVHLRGVQAAVRQGPLPGSTPRPWTQRAYGECCFPVDGGACGHPRLLPAHGEAHRAVLRGPHGNPGRTPADAKTKIKA